VFMPESGPATDVTAEEVIDVEELD
jgi:hypothetical protein